MNKLRSISIISRTFINEFTNLILEYKSCYSGILHKLGCWQQYKTLFRGILEAKKMVKQAGLGQAQLKLELELCYTSFEILSYRLLQLVVSSGLLVISYAPNLIVLAE